MQTWMGSPSGAVLTTRTGAPGTTPISINLKLCASEDSTDATRAMTFLGIISRVIAATFRPLAKYYLAKLKFIFNFTDSDKKQFSDRDSTDRCHALIPRRDARHQRYSLRNSAH